MFGIEKAHMILDEMIMDGQVAETNRNRALAPVGHIDKFIGGKWTLLRAVYGINDVRNVYCFVRMP